MMETVTKEIRLTNLTELDEVMEIYAYARKFMAEHDNPTQWGNYKPSREQIEKDIKAGCFPPFV